MLSKLPLLCFALIFSSCLGDGDRSKHGRGYYTVVAPGTVRSQSPYHVSIALDDFHQSCWFNVSVLINGDDDRHLNLFKTVEVKPRSVELVQLDMPSLRSSFGTLAVSGYEGIISRDSAMLNVEEDYFSVIIQTDKPKYKPGDLLKFRVIFIDRLTLPAVVDGHIAVVIYDGQGHLIKEFSEIELVQGVFRGDLQLSEHPVLGEWKMEALVDGKVLKEKVFRVARYVLLSFSVEVTVKGDVPVQDNDIEMTIKASYTYGEPVKGNLSLSVHTIDSGLEEQEPRIFKELQIDGITKITLDLKTLLNATNINIEYSKFPQVAKSLALKATVQDSLTRQTGVGKSQLKVHSQPYVIQVHAPEVFDPKKPVEIKVSVKDLQEKAVQDTESAVGLVIEGSPSYGRGIRTDLRDKNKFFLRSSIVDVLTGNLDKNGSAAFLVDLKDKNFTMFRLKGIFLAWSSRAEFLKKMPMEGFHLDILTPQNEVGKELVVKLTSPDIVSYFTYDIISRGNIIHSDRVIVPGNDTTYMLRINATYEMVPKITLFVHRIKDSVFDSALKDVYIKRDFQNSVKISADSEAEPGEKVSVNVTTDEGSYVGLVGLDQKILLSDKQEDDLSEDHIFTTLQNYDSLNLNQLIYPAVKAGLVTFSNSRNRAGFEIGQIPYVAFGAPTGHPLTTIYDKPEVELPRIRQLFADGWLFEDFERSPKEGLHIRETVPDSITSWALTGFSLNPKTGFSLTKNVTKLKVFQPFFVTLDLPSLVKEGEIIETPVYAFNYLDQDLDTDVTIESDSEDVEFLDNPTKDSAISSNQTIFKSIPAQGKAKLVFFIRPRKSGEHDVTVKAISSAASDAIQKPLTVESEGVPHSFSKTYLVHFLQDGDQEDELLIDIPGTAVSGSENVQLSVVGDVFGPLVKSLQKLARVPHGNGEENMKNFVSNVLVLKYLKTFNHSNPSLEAKTKLHLELGYQTQMVFKHLDGSFSLFDRTKERTGDLWVTAYVMWGLQQASEHITVDPYEISRGLEYLQKKQNDEGAISRGRGLEDDVGLTAFTLLAFMVTDESRMRTQDNLKKGLNFLFQSLDELEEATSSAITKYVLILGKHEKSGELLSELKSTSGFTSSQMEWIKQDTLQSSLEVTASSFMSLLQSQMTPVETLFPVVRALALSISTDKTPVHLVALDAMIKIAHDMEFGTKDLSITFTSDQGESGALHVDSGNAHLQQTVELKGASRKVRLQTKGHGFAVVNIKYEYNLPQLDEPSSLLYAINSTVKESTDLSMVLEVCLARQSSGNRSNLTVLEVNLQSGYEISERTFDVVVEKNELVKSIQLQRNAGSVRAYIENLDRNGTCVQLEALKTYKVFERKPISVVVYDAYNEQMRFTSSHELND